MAQVTDREILETFPDAPIDHDNKEYYRGRLTRRLLLNRCSSCDTWSQPPRGLCPNCWSDDVVASEVSGDGVIYITMFLHQGPPAPGVDYSAPYPVVVVELDEQPGLRYTATVLGAARDDIAIGKRVRLDWIERGGEPTPVFRVVEVG
ncbi:OB-fold domain-containing protein [Nocardia sp. NPDC005366]|uniref:Zn-ribbon domain-containing OB-fold protein n=1 Tax=Nocardia sp. NPDC005366 TaxID=3156878 RepID=UPI0033A94009